MVIIQLSRDQLEDIIRSSIKNQIENLIDLLPKEADELFTRKEAALYLKVSLPTLDSWTKEGSIPYSKIGKSKRYSKNEINKLIRCGELKKYRNY